MAAEKINIERFIEYTKISPLFDVRSPGEFKHAHIPGAENLPLFSDEERKVVGTLYKQEGRQQAIKAGLDFFGPKMKQMVEEVETILKRKAGEFSDQISYRNIMVHCWRGGMRSTAVAWLLDLYGFKVCTPVGGYKAYRNWVLKQFELPYQLRILGGFTGTGKTEILKELGRTGEAIIIDLEELASHKGSAFGNINMPAQPSQEMFENLLANELYFKNRSLRAESPQDSIWLEDESQRIGSVNIPNAFWNTMRRSKLYFLDVPFSKRLSHIIEEYGNLDKTRMTDAVIRIRKRLGGLETKNALGFIEAGNIEGAFQILLKYYDKCYMKGLNGRDSEREFDKKIHDKEFDISKILS